MRRCGTLITMLSKEPAADIEGDENKKRKAKDETKVSKKKK
jgi:hypothetical protein